MNVLLLSMVDLGGVCSKQRAALLSIGISCRHITARKHLYPVDLFIPRGDPEFNEKIKASLEWADIVQIQEHFDFWDIHHPALVYHPVGSHYYRLHDKANRWVDQNCKAAFCSTPTTYGQGDGRFEFIGVPCPELPKVHYQSPIRLCHAVTRLNRGHLKNTPLIQDVAQRLGWNKVPAVITVIHNQSHEKCLRIKRECQITIDQPGRGGYGLNSIEAWAMGMPVISGFSGERAGSWYEEVAMNLWGGIPFYQSNGNTVDEQRHELFHGIKDLTHQEVWNYWAKKGREHYMRFHSPSAVGEQLKSLYERIL